LECYASFHPQAKTKTLLEDSRKDDIETSVDI
jgi:hypothetical protein